eukprot:6438218-Pyramimonas_sp.AAC.1
MLVNVEAAAARHARYTTLKCIARSRVMEPNPVRSERSVLFGDFLAPAPRGQRNWPQACDDRQSHPARVAHLQQCAHAWQNRACDY